MLLAFCVPYRRVGLSFCLAEEARPCRKGRRSVRIRLQWVSKGINITLTPSTRADPGRESSVKVGVPGLKTETWSIEENNRETGHDRVSAGKK